MNLIFDFFQNFLTILKFSFLTTIKAIATQLVVESPGKLFILCLATKAYLKFVIFYPIKKKENSKFKIIIIKKSMNSLQLTKN